MTESVEQFMRIIGFRRNVRATRLSYYRQGSDEEQGIRYVWMNQLLAFYQRDPIRPAEVYEILLFDINGQAPEAMQTPCTFRICDPAGDVLEELSLTPYDIWKATESWA